MKAKRQEGEIRQRVRRTHVCPDLANGMLLGGWRGGGRYVCVGGGRYVCVGGGGEVGVDGKERAGRMGELLTHSYPDFLVLSCKTIIVVEIKLFSKFPASTEINCLLFVEIRFHIINTFFFTLTAIKYQILKECFSCSFCLIWKQVIDRTMDSDFKDWMTMSSQFSIGVWHWWPRNQPCSRQKIHKYAALFQTKIVKIDTLFKTESNFEKTCSSVMQWEQHSFVAWSWQE